MALLTTYAFLILDKVPHLPSYCCQDAISNDNKSQSSFNKQLFQKYPKKLLLITLRPITLIFKFMSMSKPILMARKYIYHYDIFQKTFFVYLSLYL